MALFCLVVAKVLRETCAEPHIAERLRTGRMTLGAYADDLHTVDTASSTLAFKEAFARHARPSQPHPRRAQEHGVCDGSRCAAVQRPSVMRASTSTMTAAS